MRRTLAVALAVCGLAGSAPAQEPRATPADSGLAVYLVTIGQGRLYFEKYGHNMLWFSAPAHGVDVTYNWGTFDFNQPGFLRRVLLGDPLYSVEGVPSAWILQQYRAADRTIRLQRLNFTPAQAARAFAYAQWNAREENKHYRYDYFLDNCSTRVRDLIDYALGGALKLETSDVPTPLTYKSETVRLLDDMTLTQFGVQVALGRPADRPLSAWEAGFIPMRLADAAREVRIPGPAGVEIPLVTEERLVYESTRYLARDSQPVLWLPYLLVGLLLAATIVALGFAGERSRGFDIAFRLAVTLWAKLTGFFGVVLLLAWLLTRHTFWFFNENLLLFNPVSLWLAALVFATLWRPRYARPAAIVAVVVAMLGAVALLWKGLPGFSQDNLPLILLLLPAHFAAAYGLVRRAPRPAREPAAP